jgi:hypothetical protein
MFAFCYNNTREIYSYVIKRELSSYSYYVAKREAEKKKKDLIKLFVLGTSIVRLLGWIWINTIVTQQTFGLHVCFLLQQQNGNSIASYAIKREVAKDDWIKTVCLGEKENCLRVRGGAGLEVVLGVCLWGQVRLLWVLDLD